MNILAYKVACAIKNANPEETQSVAVMQYALGIIFNTLFSLLAALLIGLFTGQFLDTAIAFLTFVTIRMLSGGFHLKSAWACNIATIVLCTVIPHAAILITSSSVMILNIISLISMVLLAPRPDHNTRIPPKWFPLLKMLSVLVVILNFFLAYPVIGLVLAAQSFTLYYWKGGSRHVQNHC
ncbi:accessory regulator AgrB [Paenibacillaceae bacterium]|nr:accessory regulator AgrB [Paenibacillaceae bacterium]